MASKKVPDSALREAIKANPTGTYTAIAKAVGLATGGYTYKRIDKIRAEINGSKSTEPTLAFSDIKENDRLMRAGKRLVVITTDPSYIRVRRMDGTTETISRKDFSEHAAEYTRVPAGDSQCGPVTTYYIPPGTEPGDIEVDGTAIKDLPDEDKRKIIDSFTSGLNGGPEPSQLPQPGSGGSGCAPGMTINQDFEEAVQEMEAINKPKPPLFEDVDYIDPDWGVIEKEATEMIPARRDYLDRIDQLLDIMVLECRANPLLRMDVMAIATSMLNRGFDEEVRDA